MILAGICPLKDEGILFFNRMVKQNVDAEAVEIRLMPHGFLSYHIPFKQGMSESLPAIQRTVQMIREMMN